MHPDVGVIGVYRHSIIQTVHDGEVAQLEVGHITDKESETVDYGIIAYTLEGDRTVGIIG